MKKVKTIVVIISIIIILYAIGTASSNNNANNTTSLNKENINEKEKNTKSSNKNDKLDNKNILISSIKERDVTNGIKTKKIGTMGYIDTTLEQFKSIDEITYSELMEYISNKKYNYFIIYFTDNKRGLHCSGILCSYCDVSIDKETKIYESGGNCQGAILQGTDGKYYYQEYDE